MFLTSHKRRMYRNSAALFVVFICTAVPALAEGPKQPSSMSNSFAVLMVIIISALALIIFMMGRLVIASAYVYLEKLKKEEKGNGEKKNEEQKNVEQQKQNSRVSPAAAVFGVIFLLLTVPLFAQDKAVAAVSGNDYGGLSSTAYYLLISVVFIELLLIVVLLYMFKVFAGIKRKQKVSTVIAGVVATPEISWWDRFNKLRPINEEVNIDLGHNYDGIRELDNRLPPWWLYGFYCTIVFAFVYFYMHEVSHSAPSGVEEYQIAVANAQIENEAYLKKAANNIDERTVKLLTDEASITAGRNIFLSTAGLSCSTCHGKYGEGGVGPNLTDDYWLHGGGISDVFKTIKYGWADKGMKSWKDDFSPLQIAQIASYVKSLHGTKPANAKPPQGTLYTEAVSNPVPAKKDSVVIKKNS